MGGDLERLALIRNPGPDPLAVVAALADGIDLVVLDTTVDVAPARARTLAGRVRTHQSVLLVCGRWPHPDLRVRSQLAGAEGLGAGRGRLQRVRADRDSRPHRADPQRRRRAGRCRRPDHLGDPRHARAGRHRRARAVADRVNAPDRHPALRRLARPRLVLIAPARAWTMPDRAVLRPPGTALAGIRSFDTQRDRPAVLGQLDTWARL